MVIFQAVERENRGGTWKIRSTGDVEEPLSGKSGSEAAKSAQRLEVSVNQSFEATSARVPPTKLIRSPGEISICRPRTPALT